MECWPSPCSSSVSATCSAPEEWRDGLVGFSFWALNLGLAWMVFANLFPIGILQLGDAVANGYWHARSIEFFNDHAMIEWWLGLTSSVRAAWLGPELGIDRGDE